MGCGCFRTEGFIIEPMIIDTHAHYNDARFDEDRNELIASLAENGIGKVINVSAEWDSVASTKDLVERVPFFFGALGIHPDEVGCLNEERLSQIESDLCLEKIVAVGEIGLDYHWMTETKEVQEYWFREQLNMAKRAGKPVIIHSRDAAEDTLRIMKDEIDGLSGGVMHCYGYSLEHAREYVDMGLYLGIGGVVTFKNGRKLKEVVREIPLTHLLLETDCPYMAPAPHRGERNSSLYLPLVAEAIAELKGISSQEVIGTTAQNAESLFNLSQ